MVRVYKINTYVCNIMDKYNNIEQIKDRLSDGLSYFDILYEVSNIEKGKYFIWQDNCVLNMFGCTKEDWERYFKIENE